MLESGEGSSAQSATGGGGLPAQFKAVTEPYLRHSVPSGLMPETPDRDSQEDGERPQARLLNMHPQLSLTPFHRFDTLRSSRREPSSCQETV